MDSQTNGEVERKFPAFALICDLLYIASWIAAFTPIQYIYGAPFVIITIMVVAPFLLLAHISKPADKSKVRCEGTPMIPDDVCVLTGKPAVANHLIVGYRMSPSILKKQPAELPFSKEGWEEYSRALPVSLKIYKAGMRFFVDKINHPKGAVYVWTPIMGYVCGIIAGVEVFFGKRQLVSIRPYTEKEYWDIRGTHQKFAEAFAVANGEAGAGQAAAQS